MGFSFNGTQANVTITGSTLAEKHPNGWIQTSGVSNTTTTMGTVGAGKKWTILGVSVSNYAGAGSGIVTVKANSQPILSASVLGNPVGNVCNAVAFDYNYAPQITVGQTISLTSSSATSNGEATVIYIEETA